MESSSKDIFYNENKISQEFHSRLDHMEEGEIVTIIVLFHTPSFPKVKTRIEAKKKRQAQAEKTRQVANQALEEINPILQSYGGKFLSSSADVLGSIPIEISVAGVLALSTSPLIKVILEDQPVSLIS